MASPLLFRARVKAFRHLSPEAAGLSGARVAGEVIPAAPISVRVDAARPWYIQRVVLASDAGVVSAPTRIQPLPCDAEIMRCRVHVISLWALHVLGAVFTVAPSICLKATRLRT